MRNSYRKSLLILFTLFALVLCNGFCIAESQIINTISSEVEFSFVEPEIEHEAITEVLANGVLNAKVFADFGDCTYADAVLEYKIDSGEVVEVKKENINDGTYFYIGTPQGTITKDNTSVEYRIKVMFTSDEENFTLYAPAAASSTTFATANVVSKIEQSVDGDAGAIIEIGCGDQSKINGNIKVTVPAGAYSGNHVVKINFIEDTEEASPAPKKASSKVKENIISTLSVEIEGISELDLPIQIDNLPLQKHTEANRFSMQYQRGSVWESAQSANLKVDKTNQTFSFTAKDLGYYRVLENIDLTDSSYRPENRIVIKGKIGERYPGFEFKYLKEGDSITIYDLKGKKIRKIAASGTELDVWDGKKDNGDWAKSGIYIYQLKHDGSLVSGTIVFVY